MADAQSPMRRFGTLPVFLTSLSTILGAILFLRFGWAVGQQGLLGTLAIILLGHLVTIPTSLAIAEIATNQRVEGGGAYYIISRSFGLKIGGAIGIALYLSQALSVAFYVIAFAQSSGPLFEWMQQTFDLQITHFEFRLVSVPTLILITLLVVIRGAGSGMNALYLVAAILGTALLLFFIGKPIDGFEPAGLQEVLNGRFDPGAYTPTQLEEMGIGKEKSEPFIYVFVIIFPAFTGIIAGLGLSGDLKEPGKSIPLGTLLATIVGMVIYILVGIKFALSIPPEVLVNRDRLVMSDIVAWEPIIPIGLAAGTISSALGSILVAPRTLQALGADKVMPSEKGNQWLARLRGKDGEPINATLVTVMIAFVFVLIGGIDFVAEIISMFFMVTYGAICLISFLEHFAGDPAYRPSFSSRWYFSLLGAVLCLWLMFQMNTAYAIVSLSLMGIIYYWVSRYHKGRGGMARIFRGVIFQISRSLRVLLQKQASEQVPDDDYWVPSVVCLSEDSFERQGAFDLVRFISHKYGFGTYIHLLRDYLSKATAAQADQEMQRLLLRSKMVSSKVFLDTLISPSYTTALAQVLQLPGISGQDNNTIIFEYPRHDKKRLHEVMENHGLIRAAGFDVGILQSAEKGFGYKKEIHVWLSPEDYENGNLMILMAYIILGHPEWHGGQIKIFAVYPEADLEAQKLHLLRLIEAGRLAISPNNIEVIARKETISPREIINKNSADADLTLIGFRTEALKREQEEVFEGYDKLGNILFINTGKPKRIS